MKLCFTALALWSLIAAGLRAQENWGTIRGTVKDSSGAVIPGATLTATSPTLVRPIEVATDDKGTYLFPKLPIGTYTITASLTGFKTVRKEDIPVRLGLEPTVDFVLAVGNVSETITVTAANGAVDVTSSKTVTRPRRFVRPWTMCRLSR